MQTRADARRCVHALISTTTRALLLCRPPLIPFAGNPESRRGIASCVSYFVVHALLILSTNLMFVVLGIALLALPHALFH